MNVDIVPRDPDKEFVTLSVPFRGRGCYETFSEILFLAKEALENKPFYVGESWLSTVAVEVP